MMLFILKNRILRLRLSSYSRLLTHFIEHYPTVIITTSAELIEHIPNTTETTADSMVRSIDCFAISTDRMETTSMCKETRSDSTEINPDYTEISSDRPEHRTALSNTKHNRLPIAVKHLMSY